MPRSCPPARPAPPRCWKSCGTRPARTTPRSPRRRGCGPRWRIAGATRPGQRASERTWRTSGPSTRTWSSASLGGSARRQVVAGLPEGGRALVVGHSPTTEAAVLGLAGLVVPPLGKGKGVLLVEDGGAYQVEPLD